MSIYNVQPDLEKIDLYWFHASGLSEAGVNEEDCKFKLRGQSAVVAIISDGIYADHEGFCGLNIVRKKIGTNENPIVNVGPDPSEFRGEACFACPPRWHDVTPTGDAIRGTAMAGILAGRSPESRTSVVNHGCFPLNHPLPVGVGLSSGSFCPLTLRVVGFSGKNVLSSFSGVAGGASASVIFDASDLDGLWQKCTGVDCTGDADVWKKSFNGVPDSLTLSWVSGYFGAYWGMSIVSAEIFSGNENPHPIQVSFRGDPLPYDLNCLGCPLGSAFVDPSGNMDESHYGVNIYPVFEESLTECEEVTQPDGTSEGIASQIRALYDYPYLYKSYWESLAGNYESKMSQSLTRLLEILNSVEEDDVDVLIMDLNPSVYPISSGCFYGLSTGIREGIKNKIIEIAESTTVILTSSENYPNPSGDDSYAVFSDIATGIAGQPEGTKNFLLDSLMPEIRPYIINVAMLGRVATNPSDSHPGWIPWPPFTQFYPCFSLGEKRMMDNGLCFIDRGLEIFLPGVPIFGGRPTSLPEVTGVFFAAQFGVSGWRITDGPIPGPLNSIIPTKDYGFPSPRPVEEAWYEGGPSFTAHLSAAMAGGVAAIIHGFKRSSAINELNVIQTLKGCVYYIPSYSLSGSQHESNSESAIYQSRHSHYNDDITRGGVMGLVYSHDHIYPDTPHLQTTEDKCEPLTVMRREANGPKIHPNWNGDPGGPSFEKEIYIKGWNESFGYGTTNFKLLGRVLSSYASGLNPIGDDYNDANASVQLVPCQREWFTKYFPQEEYNPESDLSNLMIIGTDNTKSGWPDIGWPPFSTPERSQNFNEGVTAFAPPVAFQPEMALCGDNFMGWPMASCLGSDLALYSHGRHCTSDPQIFELAVPSGANLTLPFYWGNATGLRYKVLSVTETRPSSFFICGITQAPIQFHAPNFFEVPTPFFVQQAVGYESHPQAYLYRHCTGISGNAHVGDYNYDKFLEESHKDVPNYVFDSHNEPFAFWRRGEVYDSHAIGAAYAPQKNIYITVNDPSQGGICNSEVVLKSVLPGSSGWLGAITIHPDRFPRRSIRFQNSVMSGFNPLKYNEQVYWKAQLPLPIRSLYSGEYLYWDDNIDKWIMSMSLGGAPIEIGDEENPRQAIMDKSPTLCPIGFWEGFTDYLSLTKPIDIVFAYPEDTKFTSIPPEYGITEQRPEW